MEVLPFVEEPSNPAISGIGYNQCPEDTPKDVNIRKVLMEQQNKNLMALLQALKPVPVSTNITLHEFNPDTTNVYSRSWISTADMCLSDEQLHGAPLMMALSRELKGQVSS